MFSAADLLEVLRRRRTLKSIRPEEPGRMPPGWERWLQAMPARGGAVTGAAPVAFIDLLLQRPPRSPPRRSVALGRWQAFATLWRQQWHPPLREERGLRIAGMATSVAVHACFAVLLAWLMHLHFLVPLPTGSEPAVVQVEFIGTGTPDEAGGGPVPPEREVAEPAAAAASAAAPSPLSPSPTPGAARPSPADEPEVQARVPVPPMPEIPVDVAQPNLATVAPPVPVRAIPTPVLPVQQPLQVTEVAQPDIAFVLPPTTPPEVPVRAPELALPTRDIPAPEAVEDTVEVPLATVQLARRPEVAVDVPEPRPVLAVPSRQVPTPEPAAIARLPSRPVQAPDVAPAPVAARVPAIAVARIPAPEGSADAQDTPAAGEAADGNAPDASAAADDAPGQVADTGATQRGAASAASAAPLAGAGPEPVAAPGGWPSPARGDDWDDALRTTPGGQAAGGEGLFDGTGRPQLAGTGQGSPPGGAPPGSEARQAIDLERGGTWLQRPPLDHRPTRFDAFWIPTGTLLEEWVRRGVKQMSIPIPGTSMEIVCVVSVLQLGGGCGLSDPNVNEQPSSGRPSPDVPFKPELHEDQDSLARPPGG